MDHHLAPLPHRETSLPSLVRSIPVEIAALPASTRTSFTRVDNTPPCTSVDQRDEVVGGSPPADYDDDHDDDEGVARELPPSREEQPEEPAPAPEPPLLLQVPQVPQTLVQFLLVSGRRRTMGFEPETTVGRVKELVWNSWPNGAGSFSYMWIPTPCHASSATRESSCCARGYFSHSIVPQ